MKKGDFDDRLVDAFRAAYLPNVLSSLQNPGWIYAELLERYDMQRFENESTSLQRLPLAFDVSKTDVVDVANKYLGENRLTVVVK